MTQPPNSQFSTRPARPEDATVLVELLPRLADFPLPPNRDRDMLWSSDAKLLRRWADGDPATVEATSIRVGVDADDRPVAGAIVTYNTDHFSKQPNAHLEVLVVGPEADGHGLGRRLLGEVETEAAERGAHTVSLHVVANNARARHVYEKLGYDEEMIRAIKHLNT